MEDLIVVRWDLTPAVVVFHMLNIVRDQIKVDLPLLMLVKLVDEAVYEVFA